MFRVGDKVKLSESGNLWFVKNVVDAANSVGCVRLTLQNASNRTIYFEAFDNEFELVEAAPLPFPARNVEAHGVFDRNENKWVAMFMNLLDAITYRERIAARTPGDYAAPRFEVHTVKGWISADGGDEASDK